MNSKHSCTSAGIDSFNENIKLQIIGLLYHVYVYVNPYCLVCVQMKCIFTILTLAHL